MATTSQVNKAGRTLRKWQQGEYGAKPWAKVNPALDVLFEYRAAHGYPLTKASMGLRSVVRTERCRIEVSQRLKRLSTIVDKLYRLPQMQLANMQDIGGCRAVLDSVNEVRRVQRRLGKNRPPIRVNDYIAEPRASGYRGVHMVIEYRDLRDIDRRVEVQLRTRMMHEWAYTVERIGGRLGEDLKSGEGPKEVLDLLEAISEAMALEEAGKIVDDALVERMNRLRQAAVPFLEGGRP